MSFLLLLVLVLPLQLLVLVLVLQTYADKVLLTENVSVSDGQNWDFDEMI